MHKTSNGLTRYLQACSIAEVGVMLRCLRIKEIECFIDFRIEILDMGFPL